MAVIMCFFFLFCVVIVAIGSSSVGGHEEVMDFFDCRLTLATGGMVDRRTPYYSNFVDDWGRKRDRRWASLLNLNPNQYFHTFARLIYAWKFGKEDNCKADAEA